MYETRLITSASNTLFEPWPNQQKHNQKRAVERRDLIVNMVGSSMGGSVRL